MKTINITFEDREFKDIEKVKNRYDFNWREFILYIIKEKNDTTSITKSV